MFSLLVYSYPYSTLVQQGYLLLSADRTENIQIIQTN